MEFRFPTAKAIDRLNRELRLPAIGGEQDWEIELADANRVEEFCAHLTSVDLNDDERFALLSLIVASAQDRLKVIGAGSWLDRVLATLGEYPDLISPIASYWCRDNDWEIASHLSKLSLQEAY
jgi:hypothetical protein